MQVDTFRFGNAVITLESEIPVDMGHDLPLFRTQEDPHYIVHIRHAEPGEKTPDFYGYGKINRDGNRFDLALPAEYFPSATGRNVMVKLPVALMLQEQQTLVIHASFVVYKGQGILFSGPSRIGKSTQAELWRKYRDAQVINGDRAVIAFTPDGIMAGGYYLSGTSGICHNVRVPLKAIVLLGQSQENRFVPTRPLSVFQMITSQLDYDFKDSAQLSAVTALVERLMAHTPIYRYSCRKDESAVADLENYLYEDSTNQTNPFR